MLHPMFGIGGSEILVILVIALLFLGPDKLPDAAKTISKGIRDLKKQSRALQQQIENDEKIGGAIRDLKSALRGEEAPRPYKPPVRKALDAPENSILPPRVADTDGTTPADADKVPAEAVSTASLSDVPALTEVPPLSETPSTKVRLPDVAGEPDGEPSPTAADDDLAAVIKPASGTVAKGS